MLQGSLFGEKRYDNSRRLTYAESNNGIEQPSESLVMGFSGPKFLLLHMKSLCGDISAWNHVWQ